VYVGEDRLDWQLFKLGLFWLWPMLGDLNQHIKNLAMEDFSSSSISGFLDITEEGDAGSRSLNSLLEKTASLSSSDPRDRLYAIRGLAIPKEIDYIIPDYSKTTEEVFKDFTLRRILDAADGNILSRCLLQNAPSNLQMPSWVPDLSLNDLPSLTVDFQAAGRSKIVAISKGESLVIKGIRVATLTHVVPFIRPSDTDSEIIERCRSWKQLCRSDTYAGGGSTIDAFFEAILCGQIKEMLPLEFGDCMSLDECKRVLENLGVEEDRDRRGRE
jgi:flavoprotein